jgi:hypothetical protein
VSEIPAPTPLLRTHPEPLFDRELGDSLPAEQHPDYEERRTRDHETLQAIDRQRH